MSEEDKIRIQRAIHYITWSVYADEWVKDIAIDAMKKQIPKKPIEKPEKYSKNFWHLYCPSCENWIGIWNSRVKHRDMYNNSNSHICPYCGQAIDWSEEE